ncbi:MAG: ABC transporter substrate-binding protein [Armatimonadetes bacterium]|nr:ABC transporter substrate-binding protein [Armatimonadota bacterium]
MTDDRVSRGENVEVVNNKQVSRREFLRIAGLAGAAIGVGTGFGGLLSACGEEETTTTTGAPGTTGGATTTAGVTTTTAAAGPEQGRVLKFGVCTPQTGNMAVAAVADDWWTAHAAEAVKDGVICGDKKLHHIEIVRRDNQSDANRASQVTSDLIMNDKVDLLTAYGWPDGVIPAADMCESLGTPGLFCYCPWQVLFLRDSMPKEGYKYIWGLMMGSDLTVACFVPMFDRVPTNKRVGMLFANDADAVGWMAPGAAPDIFKAGGYELVVPGYYTPGAEDFTAQIGEFRREGCEIICGANSPPDFVNFWKQSVQQGFQPKLVSTGRALNFPEVPESLGEIGYGVIGEIVWCPYLPFKDSLTGQTTMELAEDFEASQNMQWRYPIGDYSMFEWAVDIFKRAPNPEDHDSVASVIPQTKMETIYGPIDFTEPVGPNNAHVAINNVRPWLQCGQWVKGTGKWKYDMKVAWVVTGAAVPPENLDIELHTLEPMRYSS